jgi:hypothetical protein
MQTDGQVGRQTRCSIVLMHSVQIMHKEILITFIVCLFPFFFLRLKINFPFFTFCFNVKDWRQIVFLSKCCVDI